MNKIKNKILAVMTSVILITSVLLTGVFSYAGFSSYARAAVTTPATINYQGRLLSNTNVPLSGNYTFRFSLWNTADWVAGDTDGAGAINAGSAGYVGWQETHNVTTDAFGLFNMSLGSFTPFPSFNASTHRFLQVEVKSTGQPDTSYEILDPEGDLTDLVDRKTIHNQPYAQNADTIDNAEIGLSSGDIVILGAGNVFPSSVIPGGTDADTFIIDNSNAGGDVKLQFGALLNESLKWDVLNSRFNLSNDLYIEGGLTASGVINFSAADSFRIRENANPNALATCGNVGELIFNTGTNKLMYCTVIGSPGTWANVDSAGAVDDFETVYTADADKTLNTANGDFTVNTGTGDFVVSSNDWSVDASGNATFTGTVNGVDLSAISFNNLATRVKQADLLAEFDGSVVRPDGTNNKGSISVGYVDLGGSAKRNYYEWNSQQGSLNDIDVVITFTLPLDFVSFTATPLSLNYQTGNAVLADNRVDVTLHDSAGSAVALTGGTGLANAAWTTANITFGGAPTFTAGQKVTFLIKLSATNAGFARISDLILNYNGR